MDEISEDCDGLWKIIYKFFSITTATQPNTRVTYNWVVSVFDIFFGQSAKTMVLPVLTDLYDRQQSIIQCRRLPWHDATLRVYIQFWLMFGLLYSMLQQFFCLDFSSVDLHWWIYYSYEQKLAFGTLPVRWMRHQYHWQAVYRQRRETHLHWLLRSKVRQYLRCESNARTLYVLFCFSAPCLNCAYKDSKVQGTMARNNW